MFRFGLLASVMVGCGAGAALADDGLVYAIDIRGTDFFTFDPIAPGAGRVTRGLVPYGAASIEFDSQGDVLYGVSEPDSIFGTISTVDGFFTTIGVVSGDAAGVAISGLSIDPTNETFYVTSTKSLYTLDDATGVATLVGEFFPPGDTSLMIDIAIDVNGNMYGHDIIDDALYSINKATGSATLIGFTGLAANFAQGMDFDYATNRLYATIYTGGGTGQYVEWNVTNGSITSLFNTAVWDGEFVMAIRSPAPPPGPSPVLPGPGGCNSADLNDAASPNPASVSWGIPDGILTPTDFSAFAFFFSTGDLRADLNDAGAPSPAFPNFGVPDGILTPTDFSAFAAYFATGCPCALPGCP